MLRVPMGRVAIETMLFRRQDYNNFFCINEVSIN